MRLKTVVIAVVIILVAMVAVKKLGFSSEGFSSITGAIFGGTYGEECRDSDNGIKESKKGFVSGTDDDKRYFRNDDECMAGILVEYYCEDNKVLSKNIRCDDSCENGRCV